MLLRRSGHIQRSENKGKVTYKDPESGPKGKSKHGLKLGPSVDITKIFVKAVRELGGARIVSVDDAGATAAHRHASSRASSNAGKGSSHTAAGGCTLGSTAKRPRPRRPRAPLQRLGGASVSWDERVVVLSEAVVVAVVCLRRQVPVG